MRRLMILSVIAAFTLGGCTLWNPSTRTPVTVTRTIQPTPPAPECSIKGDPTWREPSDKPQELSALGRVNDINRRNFEELRRRRAVCESGLPRAQTGAAPAT